MRYTQDLSASLHDHYISLRTKENWPQEKGEKERPKQKAGKTVIKDARIWMKLGKTRGGRKVKRWTLRLTSP